MGIKKNTRALHKLVEETLFKEYLENPPSIHDVAEFIANKNDLPLPLYLINVLEKWLPKNCGYRIEIIGSGKTVENWYAPVQWLHDQGVSVEKACALVGGHFNVKLDQASMVRMFHRFIKSKPMNVEQENMVAIINETVRSKNT